MKEKVQTNPGAKITPPVVAKNVPSQYTASQPELTVNSIVRQELH